MRLMLWIIAGLTALYCGYWAVASRAIRAGAEAAIARMRAEGTADVAAFDLAGFPARFDITLQAPSLASGDGSFRWSAPELRLYALSYRPQHLIAVLPPEQHLGIGQETIAVTSDELSASAVFGLASAAPLDHAQAVGKAVVLSSDAGWGLAADEVRAAVRRGADKTVQRVGIELLGLTLSGLPAEVVTAGGALPARGERFHLDATLGLDRPLDRFAAAGGLRVRSAEITALALDWGPAGLTGQGAVALSAEGIPEGRIDLSLRNWRRVLRLGVALGLLRPETAPTVERAAESLARIGGNPEVLTLPLVFAGGRMSLGPIPLGPAPRF
ncbi:DUF2125 domain-containing protein [Albidovulum sp.]|uniref:DUF2125 domain-containing protein n=1 Tax=Albidovulum sp. TaxID=1872424 RepID=UPI0030214E4A